MDRAVQQSVPEISPLFSLRGAVAASRRSRALRARQRDAGALDDHEPVEGVPAILSVVLLVDGSVDYQCAQGMPADIQAQALLGIRNKIDEQLERLQDGG